MKILKIKKSRYWAISDYLQEDLDLGLMISEKNKKELFNFMREYTIERVGFDPITGISVTPNSVN